MTAPDFDPVLVEQAARAMALHRWGPRVPWEDLGADMQALYRNMAEVALTAVAPTLRADGARQVFAAFEKPGGFYARLAAARLAVAHIEGGA